MDFDPYVKKTAIAGILKVFFHDPTTILSTFDIIQTIQAYYNHFPCALKIRTLWYQQTL